MQDDRFNIVVDDEIHALGEVSLVKRIFDDPTIGRLVTLIDVTPHRSKFALTFDIGFEPLMQIIECYDDVLIVPRVSSSTMELAA